MRHRPGHVLGAEHVVGDERRAAGQRGVASGMRATCQNAGTSLSIGIFFSLMIAGLASALPHTLTAGPERAGRARSATASQVATLPRSSTLFAAFLGTNPMQHLLGANVLNAMPPATPRR